LVDLEDDTSRDAARQALAQICISTTPSLFSYREQLDTVRPLVEMLENTKAARRKKHRCLSSHICSRWFRAPEIILVEKQYDTAADMWSLGCILYDLI